MATVTDLKSAILERFESGQIASADEKLRLLEALSPEQMAMVTDIMTICNDAGLEEGYRDGFADGELSERQKHPKRL